MSSVYCKSTFSRVFTNFRSFIPKSYKYNLLLTLLHRAFKLSSNFERFHQDINILPFLGKKSVQLRTCLVNSIEGNLKFCKLKVIFQSPVRCSAIKIPFRKRSALTLFTDTFVVTARLLIMVKDTRAAEHMGISNLTGKHLKCVRLSAVSDHLLECNCSIDFDHFDILASHANKFRLLIKESLLIKHDQPQLNKTIKSFP